jgi:uncharacterized protein (TIGR03083 family)
VRDLDPVLVVDLFPELRSRLLALLTELSDEEWARPTVCAGWSAKDIALHLLGDDIGNLSRRRDGFADASLLSEGEDLARWDDVVRYLNRINEIWVQAARRISPRLLCELLAVTGEAMDRYFRSLDPFALGEPVSWAGPDPAPVWLDIAREYTERWLHQQQIRDATARPGLTEPRLFSPVLDTFVRALPHTFRHIESPNGAHLKLVISGEAGGEWSLVRHDTRWALAREVTGNCDATVVMDQDVAWRLFTKGIPRGDALSRATIKGDHSLALNVIDAVSIIA